MPTPNLRCPECDTALAFDPTDPAPSCPHDMPCGHCNTPTHYRCDALVGSSSLDSERCHDVVCPDCAAAKGCANCGANDVADWDMWLL